MRSTGKGSDAYRAKRSAQRKRRYAAEPELRARIRQLGRKRRGLPDPIRAEPAVCDCCKRPQEKRAMAIDHDHDTGAFRGWLCFECNIGIGKLGDNLVGVMRAVRYLQNAELL